MPEWCLLDWVRLVVAASGCDPVSMRVDEVDLVDVDHPDGCDAVVRVSARVRRVQMVVMCVKVE